MAVRAAILSLMAAAAAGAFVAPGWSSARSLGSSRAGICSLAAREKVGRRPSIELLERKPVEAGQRTHLQDVAAGSGVCFESICVAELQRMDRSGRGQPALRDIMAEQERVEQVASRLQHGSHEVNAKAKSNCDADAAKHMQAILRKRAAVAAARQGKSMPAKGNKARQLANALNTRAGMEQVYECHYRYCLRSARSIEPQDCRKQLKK